MPASPSILEGILQSVAAAVQGINQDDGYAHDMPAKRVFRLRHRGEPNVGEGVSANVAWLNETSEEESTTAHDAQAPGGEVRFFGQARTIAQVVVDVFALPRAQGIPAKNHDADLVAWVADVVRAVMLDKHRTVPGGTARALQTVAGDRSPWRTPKYFGVSVAFAVHYIHREEDPSHP